MNIVVIGTTYVDIKGYPMDAFIADGRNSGSIQFVDGGVGRNVAENIANCSLTPNFVSLVDLTALSSGILGHLQASGIPTDYVRSTENGLGTWMAIFNNEGDVVSSISKRPDLTDINDILDQKGDELFSRADSIAVEIDIDESILERTFFYAKKYNKKVYALVSNMTIALKQLSYLKQTDCFICNQQEAGMLFDRSLSDSSIENLLSELTSVLPSLGIPKMVVTAGEKGAVFADIQTQSSGIVPPEQVTVIDTTGAGDAFFSGTVIGLTLGLSLEHSCRIGSALSASVIRTKRNVCEHFSLETLKNM